MKIFDLYGDKDWGQPYLIGIPSWLLHLPTSHTFDWPFLILDHWNNDNLPLLPQFSWGSVSSVEGSPKAYLPGHSVRSGQLWITGHCSSCSLTETHWTLVTFMGRRYCSSLNAEVRGSNCLCTEDSRDQYLDIYLHPACIILVGQVSARANRKYNEINKIY